MKRIALILITALSGWGQTKNECTHFRATLGVFTEHHAPLHLDTGQIEVSIDGQPARIEKAELNLDHHRFIVMLDASVPAFLWQHNFSLARHFVSDLKPDQKVGLLLANKAIQVRVDLGPPPASLAKLGEVASGTKQPKGSTSLVDSLGIALEMLTPSEPGDVIYLLSTGDNNNSERQAIGQLLAKTHVRLFAVREGLNGPFATTQETGARELMGWIATDSGGDLFVAQVHGADDEELLNWFYPEMIYSYELELEAQRPALHPRLHVRFKDGKSNYRLLFPAEARAGCTYPAT
jgi:hypothetical protein